MFGRDLRRGLAPILDMARDSGNVFGHHDLFGRRGPFGRRGVFGPRGPLGSRGRFGRRRAFGRASHYRSRPYPFARRRRRFGRLPQVLLGVLILAVVVAILSRREDNGSNWL